MSDSFSICKRSTKIKQQIWIQPYGELKLYLCVAWTVIRNNRKNEEVQPGVGNLDACVVELDARLLLNFFWSSVNPNNKYNPDMDGVQPNTYLK